MICSSQSGLTSNQLKCIAVVAMVLDHCAIVFLPSSALWTLALRAVGRLTAPIMCFFIAEGYYHTSNLKKYMGRLLLLALISHIPHNLCLGHSVWQFWQATDVMFPLLFGLIALTVYQRTQLAFWKKMILIAACCLLSYSGDWNYIAVLWVLAFGIFHGKPGKQMLALAVIGGVYLLQEFIYANTFPFISRFGVFLAIPLLLLYNGQRGKKTILTQWGFYWFYPVHLLIIFIVGKLSGI